MAIAVLFLSPAAGTEDAHAPNPENVLVIPKREGGLIGFWMGGSTAAAAPRSTQRTQRARAKSKTRNAPDPAGAAVSEPLAEPAWPHAATSTRTTTLVPITVKTVREMVEPSPDSALIFENELSDIDLVARPVLTQTPAPASAVVSTDGRATSESNVSDRPPVLAMAETIKAFTQSAWIEPVLLVLAGALAALSAVRLFA